MNTQNSTWTFLQTFTPQFQALGSELESKLESAKSTPSPSPAVLQELSVLLAKATKTLADATGSIPAYDQKQYETQLKGFEKSIETLRATSAPKSKFAFKRKTGATITPAAAKPAPASEPLAPTAPEPSSSFSSSSPSNLILSSRSHQYLTRTDLSEHPQQTDLSLSDLDSCVVNLLPPTGEDAAEGHIKISALHARNLTSCVLLLPEVQGSALLHDMDDCVVVLGCHQFRMHSSKNIDVLLSISSTPIIEDCTAMRFGHYPPSFYPSPLQSEVSSPPLPSTPLEFPSAPSNAPLTQQTQQPQPLSIQDFSHIRPTPSPNYSLMNEERQSSLNRTVEALRDPSAWVQPRT